MNLDKAKSRSQTKVTFFKQNRFKKYYEWLRITTTSQVSRVPGKALSLFYRRRC